MTIQQLIERLQKLPKDAVATYLHNTHGVILIDEIEHREAHTPNGAKIDVIVLRGATEEENGQ